MIVLLVKDDRELVLLAYRTTSHGATRSELQGPILGRTVLKEQVFVQRLVEY